MACLVSRTTRLTLSLSFYRSSGINAVLYFSVSILTPLMPTNAPLVAFYVTVFNWVMTLPAVYLVERMGRKTLLLWSVAGMAVATVSLAWGLNGELNALSAFGVFGFVSLITDGGVQLTLLA